MLTAFHVARRYGISLVEKPLAQLVPNGSPPTGWASLLLSDRAVQYVPRAGDAAILHDMMHLLLLPPKELVDPDDALELVPEDFVLLQVERAVAKLMHAATCHSVVKWQEETIVCLFDELVGLAPWDRELPRVPNYEQNIAWTDGLVVARALGVLDDEGQPTWRWPTWTETTVQALRCAMRADINGVREAVRRLTC